MDKSVTKHPRLSLLCSDNDDFVPESNSGTTNAAELDSDSVLINAADLAAEVSNMGKISKRTKRRQRQEINCLL